MPHRIELTEGQAIEIGGVPLAVGLARDKRVVLIVAGFDGCGLLESAEDCKHAAARLRAKVDSAPLDGQY